MGAHKEVLRLAALLLCVALATSRIGLVVHELVGHGGTAVVLGARVTEVRLFYFAGGWIRYDGVSSLAAALAIAMGGIAIELACGAALLCVRRPTLGRRIVRGIGAALCLHASWYLATGAWYGYGDGFVLYHAVGDVRYAIAIAAGLGACAAGWFGAKVVLGALAETLPRHRIAGTIVAIVLAGGVHAGLAIGELRLHRDATYTATMQSEKDRVVTRELARWQATHSELPAEARAQEQARLEREHRTFPFIPVLAIATLVSILAGAVRARPGTGEPITNRMLAIWALIAAVALAAIVVIDLL